MTSTTPDYRSLYYRWEREQWAAGAIDLSEDRRQWDEDLSPEMKRTFRGIVAAFHAGEEHSTDALVAFVDSAPTEEQQVFLTTQLVDSARHAVFYDRFIAEVSNGDNSSMESRLEVQSARLNAGLRVLLLDMLPDATRKLRSDPTAIDSLAEGVVLYHLVIEGMLGLTSQGFLLDHLRAQDLLPGFCHGFTAVARDAARHVAFGVEFLAEMVASGSGSSDVIEAALNQMVPLGLAAFEPPGGDPSYFSPLPYGSEDLRAAARGWLEEQTNAIGVELTA